MLAQSFQEVIFVGLPGPTHNYGGLSADNVASGKNRGRASNPSQAALQALELVRKVAALGVPVAILPPQLRPHLPLLRTKFTGSAEELIRRAAKENPELLEKASSSSAMWAANAATVAPGIDCLDKKLHLTAANLYTNLHRRIEAEDTYKTLSAIFAGVPDAIVHAPLPASAKDEGAANHTRLAPNHNMQGLHVFVYGADGGAGDPPTARQSLMASKAIAAIHGIADTRALFIKQSPDVIRHGVFHNDVIAVGNQNLYLAHERAYASQDLRFIGDAYRALYGQKLHLITVSTKELSVDEAVATYLFNSQIITRPDGNMTVIAPIETKNLHNGKAAKLFETIRAAGDNPIDDIQFADLRQSMRNGGGPACLRLRVPMAAAQLASIKASVNVMADDALLENLTRIIESHYPNELHPKDLADPALYYGCRKMLEEMGKVMKIPLL